MILISAINGSFYIYSQWREIGIYNFPILSFIFDSNRLRTATEQKHSKVRNFATSLETASYPILKYRNIPNSLYMDNKSMIVDNMQLCSHI